MSQQIVIRREQGMVDLSAPEIHGVTEFFVKVLDGIHKLIFGTDFPWGNGLFRLAAVIYARIPEDAKCTILGQNAARLFELYPTPREQPDDARCT